MRIAMILAGVAIAGTAVADEYVNGYMKQDGTYVQGYHRTEQNNQRWDNYSSSGNTNPYTGQRGYERDEQSSPPQYNQQNDNNGYYGGRRSSYR